VFVRDVLAVLLTELGLVIDNPPVPPKLPEFILEEGGSVATSVPADFVPGAEGGWVSQ
jgi:hypothetical protein